MRGRLSGSENEQLLWDWDRFQRRSPQTMAGYDVLVMPVADVLCRELARVDPYRLHLDAAVESDGFPRGRRAGRK